MRMQGPEFSHVGEVVWGKHSRLQVLYSSMSSILSRPRGTVRTTFFSLSSLSVYVRDEVLLVM